MELFDNYEDWLYAAVVEGGCGIRERSDHFWAENWEGHNCGEWYPDRSQGYLKFI